MGDSSLLDLLGLKPDYKLDRFDAYALHEKFTALTHKPIKMSPLCLMYYYDRYGDFTKRKSRTDKIVNDILGNMERDDQFEVLGYINSNP